MCGDPRMIWLAMAALRARAALSWLAGWIGRNPVWAALGGAVAALALCVHVIGVKDHAIARLTAQAVSFRQAEAQATVIAQQALHHQEAAYQIKSNEADHDYKTKLAGAQSAASAYIASHRLRAQTVAGSTGDSIASATGGNTGSVVRPGGDPVMVAVTANDINACTVNTQRLQAGHDWAMTLNSAVAPAAPSGLQPTPRR